MASDFLEVELDIDEISRHLFRDGHPSPQNMIIFCEDSDIPTLYEVLLQLLIRGIRQLFHVDRVNISDITIEQIEHLNLFYQKIGFKMYMRKYSTSELPQTYTNDNTRYRELTHNFDMTLLHTDDRMRFRLLDRDTLDIFEIWWKFIGW